MATLEEASTCPFRTAPFARATAESAARMVHAFEDCTLPREQWTHAAHLVVGLWYVLHHGRARAFELASAHIERYNRAAGRTHEERNGFDARVTRTWIERIADFAAGATAETLDDALLRRMLSHFLLGGESGRRRFIQPPLP